MSTAPEDFAAVVLAAGSSQRMGRDKASLPWLDGKALLAWLVETLHATGWSPVVVLGPHNHALWTGRLPAAALVLNPDAPRGKITSLAAGTAALPAGVRHILITAVDQPRPPALYRQLRREAGRESESVLVPDHDGHRGHPVVLDARLRPRLRELSESAGGLRGLLDDPAVSLRRLRAAGDCPPWDCNTPAAYREALAWFESRPMSADDGHCRETR